MQKTGSRHEYTVNKPLLLLVLSAVIIVGSILLLNEPRTTHPTLIYHSILHLAGVAMATFLSLVSLLAFHRIGGARMLFMAVGFVALTGVELLDFLNAVDMLQMVELPIVNTELSHMILMIMLAMFALGVLKFNNSNQELHKP
jgi:hypothetical protein